jgi:Ca2+/Na+ antiporter
MLGISLLIVLLVLGTRAFIALRRASLVRAEFGQSLQLDYLALLYPLGPAALLFGSLLLPQIVLLVVVAAFYAYSLVVASRQRNALECSGTDRVKEALAATSSASLGALVGLIYVGLASIIAFLGQAIQSPALGA